MNYLVFPDAISAETAQHVILLLGSRALYFEGYGRDENLIVNTGWRNVTMQRGSILRH